MELSTLTWSEFEARLRRMLADPDGLRYAADDLSQAARQALSETGPVPARLAGLDGAAVTSLALRLEAAVLTGAAAHAALARAAGRAETYNLSRESPDLAAWGAARLEEFHAALRRSALADLRASGAVPWGAGWPLDGPEGE